MIVVLLGLATGLAYGSQDFFGGMASRRASPLAVVTLLKIVALTALSLTALLAGGGITIASMGWGMASGIAVGFGNIAYFRALAIGRMGIVSTVTAIWSAIVPLVAGIMLGERPDPIAWAGIAAVVASITLIAYTPPGDGSTATDPQDADSASISEPFSHRFLASGVIEASGGGIGFGLFFVTMSEASGGPGGLAWPLLASTLVATVVVAGAAFIRRVTWRPAFAQWPAVITAGALYAMANWAYILGVQDGWVAIVAVLAALSPVPTTVLARFILRETIARSQLTGVAVALAGVALITMGTTT